MSRIPPTLDAYVEKVVIATLQKQKNAGAMAVKFEAAYLRPLDFAPASKDEAARVYAEYATGGIATPAEYKTLQDFLFKQIALEAGRLGVAVHFHTGSGCGDFFDDVGSGPHVAVADSQRSRPAQDKHRVAAWESTDESATSRCSS